MSNITPRRSNGTEARAGTEQRAIESKQSAIRSKPRLIQSKPRLIQSKQRPIQSKQRPVQSKQRPVQGKQCGIENGQFVNTTAVVYTLNGVDSNTDTLIKTLQSTAATLTKTPYTGPDAAAIGSQLQNFFNVQLELLNLLLTKAYVVYNAPYVSRSFTIVLQALKSSVDSLGIYLNDSVEPGTAVQISSNLGTLDAQYSAVIPLFLASGVERELNRGEEDERECRNSTV
ncbi:hypothetical protein B0T26DRAFT_754517 [Lasiosphaeria miniovina]|uniref:Uncharacterized protein n=1 Tax=Lasiosphaeria miniovina TaxID=1954250 RepID=A0AA40A4Q0_9PEZI|nr:uncharacterized protein B0T26DRAFT_754517 [Lasiosphaeria miniovina]KAK0709283.1 hypothetical protein B0T26DRAFT_754517 [Lasiosphaeria miniovina]